MTLIFSTDQISAQQYTITFLYELLKQNQNEKDFINYSYGVLGINVMF